MASDGPSSWKRLARQRIELNRDIRRTERRRLAEGNPPWSQYNFDITERMEAFAPAFPEFRELADDARNTLFIDLFGGANAMSIGGKSVALTLETGGGIDTPITQRLRSTSDHAVIAGNALGKSTADSAASVIQEEIQKNSSRRIAAFWWPAGGAEGMDGNPRDGARFYYLMKSIADIAPPASEFYLQLTFFATFKVMIPILKEAGYSVELRQEKGGHEIVGRIVKNHDAKILPDWKEIVQDSALGQKYAEVLRSGDLGFRWKDEEMKQY